MTNTTQTYRVNVTDLEYLRHSNTPFLARVFKPESTGPFPVMIDIHGGAWVLGAREDGDAANEALAKTGIIVVALDFRTQDPYPASIADIHYGVRWAKTQAASWNGNPNRIGAMGLSSGAHQAMLLGMRPNDPRYASLPSPTEADAVDGTLACVIMISPVIDPLGRYFYAKGLRSDCTPPPGWGEAIPAYHEQYWGTEEAMAEGAPARILQRSEKTALPPTLLLRRHYEISHPRPDVDEFIIQYRKAGGQVDATIFEEEGDYVLRDLSTQVADQALKQMRSFIYKHLG